MPDAAKGFRLAACCWDCVSGHLLRHDDSFRLPVQPRTWKRKPFPSDAFLYSIG